MTDVRIEKLQAMIDEDDATLKLISEQQSQLLTDARKINNEVTVMKQEILELTLPWKVGNIIEDETGTRYRVTDLGMNRYGNNDEKLPRPQGIRLSQAGAEAYKDSRTIYSNKLVVVPETLA